MGEKLLCSGCGEPFTLDDADFEFYRRLEVPAPRNCPQCRLLRRLAERNTRRLYYRQCSKTGKRILSQYHHEQPFPVYAAEDWWGDSWDALDYGVQYDYSRSFFEQFLELKNRVPHMALYITGGTTENSDYTNCTGYLKNCYLVSQADYDEDCYYCDLIKECKSMMDCAVCYNCELCFECLDCLRCYNLAYAQNCQNCSDSFGLFSCSACRDCIGCVNLRQAQYQIFNQQYTAAEYHEEKSRLRLDELSGVETVLHHLAKLVQGAAHRSLYGEQNQECLGNHLYQSKNAYYCFDSKDLEDCRYCAKLSLGVKDCADYNSWGDKAELIYQSAACGDNIYNLKFCSTCLTNCSALEYCYGCVQSSDLFGCVGVKRKRYCILNRQYSKSDYYGARARIVEQMRARGDYGEFFPAGVCSFAYNESMAMDYFPLTRQEALRRGFRWQEDDERDRRSATAELPGQSAQLYDDIVKEIFCCASCGKNYRIIAQELGFLRRANLPPPVHCPDCRHQRRMALRNPLVLRAAQCAMCGHDIVTAYSADCELQIVCEACYLESVY